MRGKFLALGLIALVGACKTAAPGNEVPAEGENPSAPEAPAPSETPSGTPLEAPSETPSPTPAAPAPNPVKTFSAPEDEEAARFLNQATFGATTSDIATIKDEGLRPWMRRQFETPIGLPVRERMQRHLDAGGSRYEGLSNYFYSQAFFGDDQLRWRTAFALSQIVVTSLEDPNLRRYQTAYANYVDLLLEESFGNYCDLIRRVTYTPQMAQYLTYYGNRKADASRGSMPDENYAREILQLFTIGLEELEIDGTPTGRETYTQADIRGLAAVFTGLSAPEMNYGARPTERTVELTLTGFPEHHETGQKVFLNTAVNFGSDPVVNIDAALDYILSHKNVAPFISKHLIQKFVTSNPSPAYVRRVAEAFNAGFYDMEDGFVVGEGRRCDMQATLAAVLLDEEARSESAAGQEGFGKVRSTVQRIAHVYRVAKEERAPSTTGIQNGFNKLGYYNSLNNQLPFSPPSVFGFYRPQFSPSGTELAAKGLVAPEMQIYTTSHAASFPQLSWDLLNQEAAAPKLSRYMTLAKQPADLVDDLALQMTAGQLEEGSRARAIEAVESIYVDPSPDNEESGLRKRVKIALLFIMTSPDFMVQR